MERGRDRKGGEDNRTQDKGREGDREKGKGIEGVRENRRTQRNRLGQSQLHLAGRDRERRGLDLSSS